MTYQQFDAVPAFERAQWVDGKLANRDAPVRWGGEEFPPAIGTEIVVTMNRIGRATVTGYFVEEGWLGLLVRIHDAPEWHRKQNNGDPTGHIFGPEFKLA